MKKSFFSYLLGLALATSSCAAVGGKADQGAQAQINSEARAAMAKIGAQVSAQIVWSSSRVGNHDLFLMNSDGSAISALTQGEQVDWFPRFSPDGKKIMFCRSKKGWVYERDANRNYKWDLFTIATEASSMRNAPVLSRSYISSELP